MKGVIVLTTLLLSVSDLVRCQYVPPSPCPDIFSYKTEGQNVHGVIHYQPVGQLKYVFVRASFVTSAPLPSSGYTGQLDIQGSKELSLLKMLRGQSLDYQVDFPLTSSLPRVVSVAVNGQVLCTGETDSSGQIYTLEHLLFDKGDVLSPLALNFGNIEQNSLTKNTSPSPVQFSRPFDVECGVVSGGNDQVGLVYYGTAVTPGDWPWAVAIYTKHGNNILYTCAGSLVSDQHVVTAGHCMSRKGIVRSLRDFVVKVGAFNLSYTDDPRVSLRGVKAAALHTNYNSHTLANDALIMQLDAPVVFTNRIRPICLWEDQTSLNLIIRKRGSVVGWGGNEVRESGTGEPRVASIPIVSNEDCRASRIEFHKLTSSGNTLCAGYRNGTGPCNGDSGSGLYMLSKGRWRLRGVVSVSLRPVTGEAKCNLDEYVVFTDVAQYLPWLHQHLQGQSEWRQNSTEAPTEKSTSLNFPTLNNILLGPVEIEQNAKPTEPSVTEAPFPYLPDWEEKRLQFQSSELTNTRTTTSFPYLPEWEETLRRLQQNQTIGASEETPFKILPNWQETLTGPSQQKNTELMDGLKPPLLPEEQESLRLKQRQNQPENLLLPPIA